MTYFSYEDQSYEEYEEYLVDYYGEEGQINYHQEPVYEYYYPREANYSAPPVVKYENATSKYDFSQGDYYLNYQNPIGQGGDDVGYQYETQEDGEEYSVEFEEASCQNTLKRHGGEDENTNTMEDTTSSSTPLIPKYLYSKASALKSSSTAKKRRPIKKINTKRVTTKTFDENKLGKVEEVEETSPARKRSFVSQETVQIKTLSHETPVKLVQTSDPEKSASKLKVPSTIKKETPGRNEKKIDMSNLDRNLTGSVNSKYYSLGNVNLKSNEEHVKSDDVIAWKGKSMPDTSAASSSMCLDTSNEFKPSTMSTDCTCITIDSEEYREFVKQINKIPQMQINQQSSSSDNIARSESSPPIQIGALLKTVYDANNNNYLKHEDCRDLTLDGRTDFRSEPMPGGRECVRSRRCSYKKRQTYVNPLVEVPLHSPLKVLFGFTSFGQQKQHCKRQDEKPHRKRSFFVKMFRSVITVIGCLQSIAYRYALRYILFI